MAEGPIPDDSTQLIVVLSDGWSATDAKLRRYERAKAGAWQPVGDPVASTLGYGGLGWGRGLHDVDVQADPIKREGDGRSPAGVFLIGASYGYQSAPIGTTLPYQKVDRKWRCVNDVNSSLYNRVVDTRASTKDWNTAEHMRRWDDLYELVIEVDHNHIVPSGETSVPGDGSCIFLHVWRAPGDPTVGCTAMERTAMQELLSWLRPEKNPVLVALPVPSFEEFREAWQLP